MAETRSFRFSNFGRSLLAAGISAGATQIRVTTDTGVRFPVIDPTYDEIFACTLFHPSSDDIWEVIYVTQVATDVFTIERGKEGSVAKAFSAGARIVHGVTAGFFTQVYEFVGPNPVPVLDSISPESVDEGSETFVLELTGSNFLSSSVVSVGGVPRATTFINDETLQAFVLSSEVLSSGVLVVSVTTPAPGGGTSTELELEVAHVSDPFFLDVGLLCHFDGADSSTAFVDSSSHAWSLGVVGGAQLDTTVKKYGSAALLVDGTGDAVAVPDSGSIRAGSEDFTIECWIYPTSLEVGDIAAHRNSLDDDESFWAFRYTATGHFQFINKVGGVQVPDITSAGTLALNTWHHIAVTKEDTEWKLWLNGVNDGSDTSAFDLGAPASGSMWIGAGDNFFANDGFVGAIDEFRLTVGVARYDSSFTPPTGPFPGA